MIYYGGDTAAQPVAIGRTVIQVFTTRCRIWFYVQANFE